MRRGRGAARCPPAPPGSAARPPARPPKRERLLPRFALGGLGGAGRRVLEGYDADHRVAPQAELRVDRTAGTPLVRPALGPTWIEPAPAAGPRAAGGGGLPGIVALQ